MVWDEKKPSIIRCAFLMAMPPVAVYAELQSYGKYIDDDGSYHSFRYDEDMEKQLLSRKDALINLGLAEYGAVKKVAEYLWKLGSHSSTEEKYRAAVRLALLRNPHHLNSFGDDGFGVVPIAELAEIVKSDNRWEIEAAMTNPGGKRLLGKLMNRKEPFNNLPEDRFLGLLYAAGRNSSLRDDDSNEHGPDMYAMDIQKGILDLLETYPVTEDSLQAFHMLLSAINPDHVGFADKDPRPMSARWQRFQVSEELTKNTRRGSGGSRQWNSKMNLFA